MMVRHWGWLDLGGSPPDLFIFHRSLQAPFSLRPSEHRSSERGMSRERASHQRHAVRRFRGHRGWTGRSDPHEPMARPEDRTRNPSDRCGAKFGFEDEENWPHHPTVAEISSVLLRIMFVVFTFSTYKSYFPYFSVDFGSCKCLFLLKKVPV